MSPEECAKEVFKDNVAAARVGDVQRGRLHAVTDIQSVTLNDVNSTQFYF